MIHSPTSPTIRFSSVIKLTLICVICVINNLTYAAVPSATDLTAKINENNAKVLDLQATMITTIKSSMLGGQPITQRATFYKKGNDKSRVEMIIASSPPLGGFRGLNSGTQKQTTITNGDESWMIGGDGQVIKSADSGLRIADRKTAQTDPTAYLKYFELTVDEVSSPPLGGFRGPSDNQTTYLITGTPKAGTDLANNQYFGSIKMYIDKTRFVPVQMQIYKQDGSLLMSTTMTYQQIKDVWVNDKSTSQIIIAMPSSGGTFGSQNQTMDMTVEYKGLKVNEGLKDELFKP